MGAPVYVPPRVEQTAGLEEFLVPREQRRRLKPGTIPAAIITGVVVLVVGAVVVANVAGTKEEADSASKILNIGMSAVQTADATNLAQLIDDAKTADPQTVITPFTATKSSPATVGGQTYTPTGADTVTVTVTDAGFCITVTNPGVKEPVKYDSGTRSTASATPGICG